MKSKRINVKTVKVKYNESRWDEPSKGSIINSMEYEAAKNKEIINNLKIAEDLLLIGDKVFFTDGVHLDESEIKSINICVEADRTYVSYTLLGRVTKPREEIFKSSEELFEWQRSKFASKFSSGVEKVSYVKKMMRR